MILDVLKDGTHFSPQEFGGPYKYITSKNIRFGYIDLSDIQSVSEEIHRKIYKGSPVKQGDILLTKDGANTGNVAINNLEEEFSLLSSVAILRGNKSKLENPFLFQYLLSQKMQDFIKADMSGQAITRLTLQKIGNFPILLPPLPEQRKIAAILSTWDDSLATLTNLLAAKRQQKRGLAEALLTGKKRLPGFAGEWEEKKLGEVAEINPADTLQDFQGGFIKMEDTSEEGQLLRISENTSIQTGLAGFSRFRNNDTLIAKITPCFENGKGAYVQGVRGLGLGSTEFFVLRSKADIDARWLYFQTRTHHFNSRGTTSMQGSGGQRRVPRDFLVRYDVFVPPLPEQQAIASILSTLDGEIASLEALRAKVQEQKRGLMDELLTGRIRVKVEETC
ncbi:restriction endonuclease subunit S [Deinococcus wulumuqiensis]|nr:restriction endonuclease subunit S [Deinococcus wulumuqiensis]